jgi:hypothetical protein
MKNKKVALTSILPKIDETHNLYIVRAYGKDDKSLIKLGYSRHIKSRLKEYLTYNPFIEIIGTWYMEDAKYFEKHIHKSILSDLGDEWYNEDKLYDLIAYINKEIPLPVYKGLTEINIKDVLESVGKRIEMAHLEQGTVSLNLSILEHIPGYDYLLLKAIVISIIVKTEGSKSTITIESDGDKLNYYNNLIKENQCQNQ